VGRRKTKHPANKDDATVTRDGIVAGDVLVTEAIPPARGREVGSAGDVTDATASHDPDEPDDALSAGSRPADSPKVLLRGVAGVGKSALLARSLAPEWEAEEAPSGTEVIPALLSVDEETRRWLVGQSARWQGHAARTWLHAANYEEAFYALRESLTDYVRLLGPPGAKLSEEEIAAEVAELRAAIQRVEEQAQQVEAVETPTTDKDSEDLRDVLGTTFMPAQACLHALLEKPESLTPEQERALEALVGPDWRQLGVDIEQHRSWSARASTLLRSIDLTPHTAVSDSEWTALLSEARKAVAEAHVAANQIKSRIRRPQDDPRS
jgi:hypothetical protein